MKNGHVDGMGGLEVDSQKVERLQDAGCRLQLLKTPRPPK